MTSQPLRVRFRTTSVNASRRSSLEWPIRRGLVDGLGANNDRSQPWSVDFERLSEFSSYSSLSSRLTQSVPGSSGLILSSRMSRPPRLSPPIASSRSSRRHARSSRAAEPEFSFVEPPLGGLWRVARAANPLSPSFLHEDDADSLTGGNRFDSTTHGTVYYSSSLEGCFAETTARFRPSPAVRAAIEADDDWAQRHFMEVGAVPADWRDQRVMVLVTFSPGVRFLDVEATSTHTVLASELAEELEELAIDDIDVATMRGKDRRLTRLVSQYAHDAVDANDEPAFGGIRYKSRLGDWECWAVFERTAHVEIERRPIEETTPELLAVAKLFGLRVH